LDGMRASAGMLDALMPGLEVAADRLGERPLSPAALWRTLLTTPMFTAVSPVLAPAHARNPWLPTTGYLFLHSNTTLSPEVRSFVDAGDAPVFFGLGSITSTTAREHTERMLDSVLATGGRVIAPRLAGVDESAYDPKRVLFIGFEPFDQLFGHCSLLMHHGGVGTEALGFVADVPQFITPLTIDHWYFGRRAHELGVAPAPVHLEEVSDADVWSAIEFAGRPQVRARARELGAQIRTEDGAGNAVRFLTRALRLR
ncbi:MAG: nucleotide disphospho-sugar-binding domain-containing protein, partial [Micropruina sp.]